MAGTPRSYGQRCGLALSLDLIGERWTMLILRELVRGPKRFGDLAQGLDGIGSNLLSARLKSLESAGLVEKITLPPPAPVPAYDLAERGRSLQPILEDLALWGFELVGSPQERPELATRAVWAAMTMKAVMDRSESKAPTGTYAFQVGSEDFWLQVSDDGSTLTDGRPPAPADAEIELETDEFFALVTGAIGLDDPNLRISGDEERFAELLRTFRLPPLAALS